MTDPVAAMREHAPDRERVSLHPLFAPEGEPGNVPVVADAPGPVTDTVRETLESRGNHLFETTPAEHDEAMETVQARTHATILAYALAAEDVPERFHTPVSAGLADLVGRVTGGEARVYADIQATFDGADDVAAAAERVAETDGDAFESLYDEAGR
jgi:prephenate dehydrogenase